MKRIILIIVFSLLCFTLAFSQGKDSLFEKSSVGANYMLNLNTRLGGVPLNHAIGLHFDNRLYKRFFLSTEFKFCQEKHDEEGLFHEVTLGTYYYEDKYKRYYLSATVNIKYYFLEAHLISPYIISGINNNLIYKTGFYKAHGEISEIDEKMFVFNFLVGGGAQIKILNNMSFSLELLYNIPQYYKYNLKKSGVVPYDFGIKATVSYLF